MTETKKSKLDQKEYFNIVLRTRAKRSWWVILILIIAGLIYLSTYLKTGSTSSLFWLVFCFLYPILIYAQAYRFAHSKDSKQRLKETQLFFDDDKIRIIENDGALSEFPFSRIVKVLDKEQYWMLYLNKNSFIYVTKDIFFSEEDFLSFKSKITL